MHIHTDAADYRAGERIWLRVHELTQDEDVLFVELINPQGTVTKRVKLLRWEDIFSGYLDIPSTCAAGQYLLRAYTRSMASGEQIVYIHGRITDDTSTDAFSAVITPTDTVSYQRASMPLTVTADGFKRWIQIDTSDVLPGEHVYISVSITDRYAISRHAQWTIMESFARPPLMTHQNNLSPFGEAIKGQVVTPFREKPISNAVVNMIIPGTYFFASDTTDSFGHFGFSDELVPDGRPVILTAYKANGQQNVLLRIEPDTFPAYHGIAPAHIRLQADDMPLRIELNDITDSVLLDEIEVSAKRSYESKREQQTMYVADFSFGLNKIEEYQPACLHELLLRAPGVRIEDDQCYIRGAHSIYAKNPAAIAINGVIHEDDFDLDLIPIQDVARVDIFKSGTTAIWGARGGAGVISIILKDGSELPKPPTQDNIVRCQPLGWQQPQDFFIAPMITPGRRPGTVLWDPNLHSGTIPLTVDAHPTIYDVIIEGLTSTGRLVHEQTQILVE